jgi:hypothetical protein
METTLTLSKELLTKIQVEIEKKQPEVYFDYNDELSDKQIAQIINEGFQDVIAEIWDLSQDYIYELECSHVEDVLEKFETEITAELSLLDDDYEFDAKYLRSELWDDLINYVSVDMDIKQLLKNTGLVNIRVEMLSNYDCINSHWFNTSGGGGYEYVDSYFGAMVDELNLNPAKVKKILLDNEIKAFGSFPNKKNRDGKEFVSYEDFFQEIENSSCGANLLTFVGRVDLRDLYDVEVYDKITEVIIPAGNNCGIFSSMQGGGSVMEMKLLRDKKISLIKPFGKTKYDTYHLSVDDDKDAGYGINQTYGVVSEFFGKEVTLTVK